MQAKDDEERLLRSVTPQNAYSMHAARACDEQELLQLADALPHLVWKARPDGYVDYYNDRWYEFTGLPRDCFGDESWTPALHPEDVQRCLDAYYDCISTGKLFQIEYRFQDRRTGGYRWFLGRACPVRDHQGRITRWFGTCTDIHDTRRAGQITRFLADASAALSPLTDYESTVQTVARLAVPQFGDWCAVDLKTPEGEVRRLVVAHPDPSKVELVQELDGRYPCRPSDPRGVMQVLRTAEPEWAAEIPDELLTVLTQDEEHLRIVRTLGLRSYICVPLKSRDKVLGALTFATAESGRIFDIDDVRAAEDLARRIVIAIENANLLAALQESARRKDEFLATLAHELRNPLAPISNALQIWPMIENNPAEVREIREMMERQLQQLTRLVDDLLDVSRITRGQIRLRLQQTELKTLVEAAVEAVRPFIDSCQHSLTVSVLSEPVVLQADVGRLVQVLSNLLNNAAKYTGRNGHIWVTAGREGSRAVIRVRDNGPGLPPQMLNQVFDMFCQVPETLSHSQGGLGIGLTLVKSLVELHGGSVEAHSEGLGQGCEFTVRLPVSTGTVSESKPPEPRTTPAAACLPRHRVLVVDDVPASAKTLALMFASLNQETHLAHDGPTAIEAVRTLRPQAVVLDISMPGMDGYEVARRLRQEPAFHKTVLVALTGFDRDEDRRKAFEAGFDHHLVKPASIDALRQLLLALPAPG